jgi:Caspase domain
MQATRENRWALLIGIDCYIDGDERTKPRNLRGCVEDVIQVEAFLTHYLSVPKDRHILKLTATTPVSHESLFDAVRGKKPSPVENKELPTYENIMEALKKITNDAEKDDFVYIHYSGHGRRVKTMFPELKRNEPWDESIVPVDISTGGRYVRDVELACLLRRMIAKGLHVTIVLDCCHSGGATRGAHNDLMTRGLDPDEIILKTDKSSLPHEELLTVATETWGTFNTRGAERGNNCFLDNHGYSLLAACRAHEVAHEYSNGSGQTHGLFTYWLLDSLRSANLSTLTYQSVHDRILTKVCGAFSDQTPILVGSSDSLFYGIDHGDRLLTATITKVTQPVKEKSDLELNAGRVHGVWKNMEFAIYSAFATNFTDPDKRLAYATVTEVQDVSSKAVISKMLTDGRGRVVFGCRASLFSIDSTKRKKRIKLVQRTDLPSAIDQCNTLNRVRQELEMHRDHLSRFYTLMDDQSGDAPDLHVVVNVAGEYELWDDKGKVIPNLVPGLKIDEDTSVKTLFRRLLHLEKYSLIREVYNPDPTYGIAPKIKLMSNDRELPRKSDKMYEIAHGDCVRFVISNDADVPVHIAVIDLEPSLEVSQVYPMGLEDCVTIDRKGYIEFSLEFTIPEADSSFTSHLEIIKIMATVETTNFRWLRLPRLDEESSRGDQSPKRLEELYNEIFEGRKGTYTGWGRGWTCSQVEINVLPSFSA